MLWNVWNNFQTARVTTEMEANYLVDLYRIARGLAPAESKPLRALCREYAAVMVNEEWPAMAEQRLSAHSFGITQQMWDVLVQAHSGAGIAGSGVRSASAGSGNFEQSKYEQAFSALSQMSEHRRLRQIESRMKLPGILWGGVGSWRHCGDRVGMPFRLSEFRAAFHPRICPLVVAVARSGFHRGN